MTTGELKAFAEEAEASNDGEYHQKFEKTLLRPDFHQALLDIAGNRGEIDPRRLGRYLGRCLHRVVDGVKIVAEEDSHKKQKTWWLRGA
jgi:hypothetical protein